MTPTVLRIEDPSVPAAVLEALETGLVLVFPTDTIYGLGGNPWDDAVVAKVRALKARADDLPFTLHVASVADLDRYADIPERVRPAVRALLPGPYTLLLPARPQAPPCSVAHGTVGVRVPLHAFFSSVLGPAGRCVFGTSVNVHGEEPLREVDAMIDRFPSVDLLIVGDVAGTSSDVLDLTLVPPRAVRGRLPAFFRTSEASRDD
jgi:L-threonylcarbamoyladenylate synthase